MSRYKTPPGWQRESYRHYLAAKGVKTRYLATTVEAQQFAERTFGPANVGKRSKRAPLAEETALRRLRAKSELERLTKEKVIAGRAPNAAVSDVENGRLGNTYNVEVDGKVLQASLQTLTEDPNILNVQEREALKAALKVKAVEYARADIPLPPVLKNVVDEKQQKNVFGVQYEGESDVSKEIAAIEDDRARARESALAATTRQFANESAIAGAEAVGRAPGAAFNTVGTGLAAANAANQGKGGPGTVGEIDALGNTPFFGTNVFVGNEEDGSIGPDKVPSLGNYFDRQLGTSQGQKQVSQSQKVQKEVDSLYGGKEELADVKAEKYYEKGKLAFQMGDREKLVDSITSLEAEEEKLRDRMYLVEQTRGEVLNPANRMSAHDDGGDGVLSWMFSGSGAGKLTDQTRKVNDVREGIKASNNKVAARKQLLLFDLQRMDAVVEPDRSVPGKTVKVLDGGSGWFGNGGA